MLNNGLWEVTATV